MNKHQILVLISFFITSLSFCQEISAPSLQTSLQNFLNTENTRLYHGSALPVFFMKEDTKGSPYLFDKWVNGKVVNHEGEEFTGKNILFNYNKVNRSLLVLVDSSSVVEINSGDVGSFTLWDSTKSYTFERLKNSTDLNYYEPLVKNEQGYSLYKLILTTFRKADFESRGIVSSGNKYDEYKDDAIYYVLTPHKEMVRLNPKEKSVRAALELERDKLDTFFSQHKKQKLSEQDLKEMVEFLNS